MPPLGSIKCVRGDFLTFFLKMIYSIMFYLRDSIWYLLVRLKAQAGSSNHEKRKYFRVPRRGGSAQHRQIRKKHPIHRPQSTPNKRKNETTFAASTLPPSNHTLTTHPDCAVNAIGREHNHLPPIQIRASSLQYHLILQ